MDNKLGRNWILLRGLARESQHWRDFVPLLQAAFPHAQVTALDLPGTGCCHQAHTPCTVKAITDNVRARALEQGLLRQPATFLAVSLGGMVAWEWLQRYQGDSCGAILVNTSFAGLSPFYQRMRWQSYCKFLALAVQRDLRRRELAIVQLVGNREDQYETVADEWQAIQAERPISFQNSLRQVIAAASYRPGDAKPGRPVLLLNGKGDRLVAPACSEAISEKWALELRSHPWAGHDISLDDGEWVVTQVKQWFAGCDTQV
ncbi:MAG: alpha/beta hydrolase [Methylovulum sp.]|nr:MAG: alpha/beta hydrolase [Methylovulum sp.]